MNTYSLMIHGGAGAITSPERYEESIVRILSAGERLLQNGDSALDVVEACVRELENDPLFNAGKGSVLNEEGKVELDAAIMDGRNLKAGAIAGVRNIKNPVALARAVMEKSEHVFLIGDGAMRFAEYVKAPRKSDAYFVTEARTTQLKEAKKKDKVVLDHSDLKNENKLGTVGAVARDKEGNLAAATSTGGIVNKKFGRVGDSPVIGAGVFADNETCAVSATGFGEHFLRTVLAKTVSDLIYLKGLPAQEASAQAIDYLVEKVDGLGGVIVIDKEGNCARAFSTPGMITGVLKEGEDLVVNPQ